MDNSSRVGIKLHVRFTFSSLMICSDILIYNRELVRMDQNETANIDSEGQRTIEPLQITG